MVNLRTGDMAVHSDRDGDRHFNKAGLHNGRGTYAQIVYGPHRFYFDLEGRIHRIDGFPSPYSWDRLKRTMADDWKYDDKVWRPGRINRKDGKVNVSGNSVVSDTFDCAAIAEACRTSEFSARCGLSVSATNLERHDEYARLFSSGIPRYIDDGTFGGSILP